jgi:hypothetical protein
MLRRSDASWCFRAPVSEQDAPDYYQVIKDPMDLATLEQRLLGGCGGRRWGGALVLRCGAGAGRGGPHGVRGGGCCGQQLPRSLAGRGGGGVFL